MRMHQVPNHLLSFLFLYLAARCHFKDVAYSRVQRSLPGQDDTCNYFCPAESNMTEWSLPPRFEQPCTPTDIQHSYYTTQEHDHVVVKWTVPVATDRNGDLPSVRQVNGGINGGTFFGTVWGQTHSIVYLATDKDGLTDNCYFNFTVIVPSCDKLDVVRNGSYTCTNDTAPGSSCLLTCDEGFKLSGSGNVTCGYTSMANQFPNWKNIQQCEKVNCGSPATVDNADVTCSNNVYSYNTVCKVTCHQGFLMVGPQYTICQAKGEWSMQSLCTRQRPGGTHCSPTLCNGHSCIRNHNDTYTCKCSHGWSGTTCMNPPDYCSENICMYDATCSSHNDSYTCRCDSGYSGNLCQNFPRNGHWSDWSFWSKCSVTCGSGIQTRHRACNNPPPDTYGKPCHGSHTVIKTCENKQCEVCPELKHTNDSLANLECETNQNFGLQTCTLTCKNGTIHTPWFTEFQTLKCGSETNYSWVPGIVQAPCIVPVLPDELRLDTEVTYSTIIPAEHQSVVKEKVMENIKETNCIQSTQCNATIKLLATQVGADKKTNLEMIFIRYIENLMKNASYTFDENAREKITSALFDLESTAEFIKNFTSDIFDVSIVDVTFLVEDSSLRIKGIVKCSNGQIPLNGICVECPAGTFKAGNLCVFCPKGSFQWQTGQNSCIRCPSGHTTYTVGSEYEVQCFVYKEEETTDDTDILSTGSDLAIILGPVVTLVVAIPTFVLFCYKLRDRRKKQEEKKHSQQSSKDMSKKLEEKKHSQQSPQDMRKKLEEKKHSQQSPQDIRKKLEEKKHIQQSLIDMSKKLEEKKHSQQSPQDMSKKLEEKKHSQQSPQDIRKKLEEKKHIQQSLIDVTKKPEENKLSQFLLEGIRKRLEETKHLQQSLIDMRKELEEKKHSQQSPQDVTKKPEEKTLSQLLLEDIRKKLEETKHMQQSLIDMSKKLEEKKHSQQSPQDVTKKPEENKLSQFLLEGIRKRLEETKHLQQSLIDMRKELEEKKHSQQSPQDVTKKPEEKTLSQLLLEDIRKKLEETKHMQQSLIDMSKKLEEKKHSQQSPQDIRKILEEKKHIQQSLIDIRKKPEEKKHSQHVLQHSPKRMRHYFSKTHNLEAGETEFEWDNRVLFVDQGEFGVCAISHNRHAI